MYIRNLVLKLKKLKRCINNLDILVPKNRVWPREVLEKLPLWFKGEVRKNLSQKEIARDFHCTFV